MMTREKFQELKKAFEIIRNGKKIRCIEYFSRARGWFLIDGNNALFLGRNWNLAYVVLLTLNPNKRFRQLFEFYLSLVFNRYDYVIKRVFKESLINFLDLKPP